MTSSNNGRTRKNHSCRSASSRRIRGGGNNKSNSIIPYASSSNQLSLSATPQRYIIPLRDQYIVGDKVFFTLHIPAEDKVKYLSGKNGIITWLNINLRDLSLSKYVLSFSPVNILRAIVKRYLRIDPKGLNKTKLIDMILNNMEYEKVEIIEDLLNAPLELTNTRNKSLALKNAPKPLYEEMLNNT